MLHNKILFDIYKSVKLLDKDRMDKNTMKINRIISKYQHGGTKQSDEDYNKIMSNLSSIENGFLGYFTSLQNYIQIYSKNAVEFENLLKDRLSLDSLKKLKDSMDELNGILAKLK